MSGPGWYQDPAGSGLQRWFDGVKWTNATQVASASFSSPPVDSHLLLPGGLFAPGLAVVGLMTSQVIAFLIWDVQIYSGTNLRIGTYAALWLLSLGLLALALWPEGRNRIAVALPASALVAFFIMVMAPEAFFWEVEGLVPALTIGLAAGCAIGARTLGIVFGAGAAVLMWGVGLVGPEGPYSVVPPSILGNGIRILFESYFPLVDIWTGVLFPAVIAGMAGLGSTISAGRLHSTAR